MQPPSNNENRSGVPQIIVWLFVQLGAVAVAIARFPLWAQAPAAQEAFALQFLLIAQVTGSSLLFPWLFANTRSTILVFATAWPMLALAGLLSPATDGVLLFSGACVSCWLGALALIRSPLSSTGQSLASTALVSVWALGGPILLFMNEEYGNAAVSKAFWARVALGPVVAITSIEPGSRSIAWVVFGVAVGAGVACFSLKTVRTLGARRSKTA